jgi:hypothetical protein
MCKSILPWKTTQARRLIVHDCDPLGVVYELYASDAFAAGGFCTTVRVGEVL